MKGSRESMGRLPIGLRTGQRAYRKPILKALSKLHGKADMETILKEVEELMKTQLKAIDYKTLPAGGDIRWRNAAQWERRLMVKEGLLKSNSPHGVWELTNKGVQEVERQQ